MTSTLNHFPEDAGLVRVLTTFGVAPGDLLGHGGEAWVYALDDARVLRVLHDGGRPDDIVNRQRLVDELACAQPAFELPEVIDIGGVGERVYAIERRLAGRSVMDELRSAELDAAGRARLVEAHLDAAAALGDLHLEPRPEFGDLLADPAVTAPTWHDYLETKVETNLGRSTPEFHAIDASALARDLPAADASAFVHLDAFAGNMLTDGVRITAVLDVGPTSAIGDRRLDPLAAAVYLAAPAITPPATPADVDVAMSWLANVGLRDLYEPARRWLAAYWSFAIDDAHLHAWCRSVLLVDCAFC